MRVSVQFTSRWRLCVLAPVTMPGGPPAILPSRRPPDERWLFRRGVILGFDGGLLEDQMCVFVLARYRVPRYPCSSEKAIQTIDYFHGVCGGMSIAQMSEDEMDIPAIAFVGSRGFAGKCVIHLQRRFRRWLADAPQEVQEVPSEYDQAWRASGESLASR